MKKKPQVLAFYLPQYHAIPENDKWWGKGFTEWTNVKKAKPLYWGHYQPRVPLKENYYDLSKDETMEWQMNIAKKSGVDGFCFYHYWFGGKKLLEKPVERLLENEKAELPFCLCWANEPWTRTWDGDRGAKEILMGQDYGEEKEWKEHFEYLLPFFKDKRYIKLNDKPVFVLYALQSIKRVKDMLKFWNQLAIEAGFQGIYTISVNRGTIYDKGVDAVLDFEPFATMGRHCLWKKINKKDRIDVLRKIPLLRKSSLPIIDYEMLLEKMTDQRTGKHKKMYLGMCVGWDNTARRGRNALCILENSTPKLFQKYFEKQYVKSMEEEKEFLFINAWNEWAEGTYLEPDQRFGYGYLNAIKRTVKKYADK